MTDKIGVTIRVDMSESRRLSEIVEALKSQGLEEVESHERFMIVNGSVDPHAVGALRTVKGVSSVREDSTYKTQAN